MSSSKKQMSLLTCAQGRMRDKKLTQRWNFLSTGVSTDGFTPLGAVLMGASVLLYAFIQVRLGFKPRVQA